MTRSIEIIARGVCVQNGRVLLCHGKGKGNTYLPGGHIEFNEGAAKSLEREIREEMGVTSRVGPFLGAVEHTFVSGGRRTCEMNLVFVLTIPAIHAPRVPESCEDAIEFAWVSVRNLRRAGLEPWVLCGLIRQWAARRPIPGCWASTYGDKSR